MLATDHNLSWKQIQRFYVIVLYWNSKQEKEVRPSKVAAREKESSLSCFLEAISQSNVSVCINRITYSWLFAVYTIMKPNIFWGTGEVNTFFFNISE